MTWKPSEIRQARQKPLKPILESLGYRLQPLKNGNYEVLMLLADVVIKENYWFCRHTGSAGNTIDFFTVIKAMSFHQAMNIIMQKGPYDGNGTTIRSQRGKTGGSIQK